MPARPPPVNLPVAMESSATPSVHEIDIRPVIASGGCPLTFVIETVATMPATDSLRLIAPFEPIPMCAKLAELGFNHESSRREDGAFEVLFTRRAPPPEPIVLDLREREPEAHPEPTLRALKSLSSGQLLIIRTRHHPEPLFLHLREAGASWDAEPLPDGTWQTCVASSTTG